MRGGAAGGLRVGAVAPGVGVERGGDADIAQERGGGLLRHRGLRRLPAEPAEHGLGVLVAPGEIGAPGDAVAVAVVGVGGGEDVGLRYGLQQPHADHRRGDPGRQPRSGGERAVGEVGDAVARFAQARRLAVGQRDGDLLVGDRHLALGPGALDGEILQLAAIDRVGELEDRRFGARARRRRMAAPVLQMAALARPRVEQRPEPVRGSRRGRRRDPELAKNPVADAEVELAPKAHIGRGVGERVPVDRLERRSRPAGPHLVALRRGKILRRPGRRRDPRPLRLPRLSRSRYRTDNQGNTRRQHPRPTNPPQLHSRSAPPNPVRKFFANNSHLHCKCIAVSLQVRRSCILCHGVAHKVLVFGRWRGCARGCDGTGPEGARQGGRG